MSAFRPAQGAAAELVTAFFGVLGLRWLIALGGLGQLAGARLQAPYLPTWRSSPSLSAIPARSDPKETLMRRRAKPVHASIKGKRAPAPKAPPPEDSPGHRPAH